MMLDFMENVASNSNGAQPTPVPFFQIVHSPQVFPSTVPSVPIPYNFPLATPNCMTSLRPFHYQPTHNNFENPDFSHYNLHFNQFGAVGDHFNQSPSKESIPAKRHRLNEGIVNDIQSDSGSSSNGSGNSIDVDSLFYELQSFAYEGSLFAENVSKNYRKRPCFKKIELLLSRLRQELNVHHNITSNINSQGTAWAIKDFVFVFSRIVNAWIIIRGYFYDKSEGMDDLRKEFDPKLADSFTQWQEVTLKLMKTLMGTVENLDVLTQNKSGNKQKKKEIFLNVDMEVKQHDKNFLKNFQKSLFEPKVLENSEEVQVRNHQSRSYFRAGIIKTLKMPANGSSLSSLSSATTASLSPGTAPTTPSSDISNWDGYGDLNDNCFQFPTPSNGERLYNRKSKSLPVTPIDQIANPFDNFEKSRSKKDLSSKFKMMPSPDFNDIQLELEKQFDNFSLKWNGDDLDFVERIEEKLEKIYKQDGRKIIYLLNEVLKIDATHGFDVCFNMIVEKIKNGKFSNLDEIIDEFKVLIKYAKGMVEKTNDQDEKVSMCKFITNLEAVISRKAFD